MDELMESLAKALGVSLPTLRQEIEQQRAARQRRAAAKNARFDAAMEQITDVQQVVIDRLVASGCKRNERIWQNRQTGNVAVTVYKKTFDTISGKMGTRLTTVYPDGTCNTTMEKRISIRSSF